MENKRDLDTLVGMGGSRVTSRNYEGNSMIEVGQVVNSPRIIHGP